jgi:peptidyl-prolyl cis-trans isomerase B (cyclophilin B)
MARLMLIVTASLVAACSSTSPSPSATPTSAPASSPASGPASTPAAPAAGTASTNDEIAVVETSLGTFKMKFYPNMAPKHVEHFKKLVREGFYNGLAFHRVAPENLVQGGDPNTKSANRESWGKGQPDQETVPAEFNSMTFLPGIVGAARKGDNINSATSQFFISLTNHPEWNGRYTVFGNVFEGLDVVRRISNVKLEPGTERPQEKVVIRRVYLAPKS